MPQGSLQVAASFDAYSINELHTFFGFSLCLRTIR